jgi:hypothetical protein
VRPSHEHGRLDSQPLREIERSLRQSLVVERIWHSQNTAQDSQKKSAPTGFAVLPSNAKAFSDPLHPYRDRVRGDASGHR